MISTVFTVLAWQTLSSFPCILYLECLLWLFLHDTTKLFRCHRQFSPPPHVFRLQNLSFLWCSQTQCCSNLSPHLFFVTAAVQCTVSPTRVLWAVHLPPRSTHCYASDTSPPPDNAASWECPENTNVTPAYEQRIVIQSFLQLITSFYLGDQLTTFWLKGFPFKENSR